MRTNLSLTLKDHHVFRSFQCLKNACFFLALKKCPYPKTCVYIVFISQKFGITKNPMVTNKHLPFLKRKHWKSRILRCTWAICSDWMIYHFLHQAFREAIRAGGRWILLIICLVYLFAVVYHVTSLTIQGWQASSQIGSPPRKGLNRNNTVIETTIIWIYA